MPRKEASPFAVIGIDVGGTKIAGGIVYYTSREADPEVRLYRSVPTEAKRGGAAVLDTIVALVGELLDSASETVGGPVLGVGVAAAGRISQTDGSIAYANEILPGWTGQPVQARLESTYHLPASVLNDVQGHALGELRHGAARGCQTCIMVAVGTGLGGSIVVNGDVLGGAHGFAGELGHTLNPAAAGVRCACGADGHLESIASGSGIENRYVALGGEPLSGAEISRRAAQGEELAQQVIELAGHSLGESIGSWATMIDPELVVLSGSVTKAGDAWRAALQRGLEEQLPIEMRALPIVEAKLGNNAPIIGAAERVLDKITKLLA